MRARPTILVALTAAFAAALALLTPTTATATQANTSVMVRNCDGRGEVFYLDDDGRLWHYWEFTAGGQDWSAAQPLGGTGRLIYDQISAERNKDCRLEVFGVGTNKKAYHIWQDPNVAGGWSPFSSLGGGFDGPLSVAKNEDGRLEVFGVGENARMYHAYQTAPNRGWSGWYGMNSPLLRIAPYSPAVGNLFDGAIWVHAWGVDGYEYSNNRSSRTAPGTTCGSDALALEPGWRGDGARRLANRAGGGYASQWRSGEPPSGRNRPNGVVIHIFVRV